MCRSEAIRRANEVTALQNTIGTFGTSIGLPSPAVGGRAEIIIVPAILYPFRNIPHHVVQGEHVLGVTLNGGRECVPIVAIGYFGNRSPPIAHRSSQTQIGLIRELARHGIGSPWPRRRRPTLVYILEFAFSRQTVGDAGGCAEPFDIRRRIIPANTDHGMRVTLRKAWIPPRSSRYPARRAFAERMMGPASCGGIFVDRLIPFSVRLIARMCDKPTEFGDGHLRSTQRECRDFDVMLGALDGTPTRLIFRASLTKMAARQRDHVVWMLGTATNRQAEKQCGQLPYDHEAPPASGKVSTWWDD